MEKSVQLKRIPSPAAPTATNRSYLQARTYELDTHGEEKPGQVLQLVRIARAKAQTRALPSPPTRSC
jgi:hypothetical protein